MTPLPEVLGQAGPEEAAPLRLAEELLRLLDRALADPGEEGAVGVGEAAAAGRLRRELAEAVLRYRTAARGEGGEERLAAEMDLRWLCHQGQYWSGRLAPAKGGREGAAPATRAEPRCPVTTGEYFQVWLLLRLSDLAGRLLGRRFRWAAAGAKLSPWLRAQAVEAAAAVRRRLTNWRGTRSDSPCP
jgi:hypothetical protein